jgi:hypothetical protein
LHGGSSVISASSFWILEDGGSEVLRARSNASHKSVCTYRFALFDRVCVLRAFNFPSGADAIVCDF